MSQMDAIEGADARHAAEPFGLHKVDAKVYEHKEAARARLPR
jgi:hypothetical protein